MKTKGEQLADELHGLSANSAAIAGVLRKKIALGAAEANRWRGFAKGFGHYVVPGDTITCTVDGFDVTARIEFDHDTKIDDSDSHSTEQSVTGCNDEQHAQLMAAREAWLKDEWFYCGVVLSVARKGVTLDRYAHGLWGVECNYPGSDNSYLTEVANEMLPEALEAARAKLEELLS